MSWYSGNTTYDTVLLIGFVFAVFTIVGSLFVPGAYGRFASNKMGVNLNPKLGWWLMEIPATVSFLWFFLQGPRAFEPMPLLLAAVWMIHYGNRGWFFPLSIRVAPGKKASFSVTVMVLGMLVTAIHGFLNAELFTRYGAHLTTEWFTDPRFIAGFCIYYFGFFLIVRSESIVRNLRSDKRECGRPEVLSNDVRREPGSASGDYKIPFGGAYKYVSSPQYLGELTAWTGFSLMTWGLPGLMIFLISAGNLVPRAFQTHKWYREKFPDYPKDRKALIPFVV